MVERTTFISGATGFTGRAIAKQDFPGLKLKLQVRPESVSKLKGDERACAVDLSSHADLVESLAGCQSILQLIGTIRARFETHGGYEEVDYGTTEKLLNAAKETQVDHFILMSSIGAGRPVGEYLQWKKKTEDLVRESGIPWTIVRPSYLAGDDDFPERSKAAVSAAFMRGLANGPMSQWALDLAPINIQILARVFMWLAKTGEYKGKIVRGRDLWRIAREQEFYPHVKGV